MRVGIQGWGSEGDVRPLIALAARLRREGHQPEVVLTPIDARDYREECRRLDVPLRIAPEKLDFSLETLADSARSSDPPRHAIPDVIFSDHLNLHAASPTFCPPAPDWSEIHQVCGEFFLPDLPEPWTPSDALQAFLDEGAPPVLISLGSMEHVAPERARDLLIAAARDAKVRAILQTKRNGGEGRDGALYFLPWAPHRHLLASCSVAVHHGGAGTTHAALRAGRPSVVVPFIFEQKLWARRLEQVGAAPAFVSFWKATPGKIAGRIREAAESDAMRARGAELARSMATEDGTGRATRLLEALMETPTSSHALDGCTFLRP
jgi:UDP:flavonoid glycosyltransferase YjiC (YdhE family)